MGWSDWIKSRYDYDNLAKTSDALANARYGDLGQQNAFRHAYVSAILALRHSALEAKILGNAREWTTTADYYISQDPKKEFRTDTYRDLYNNAVGRAIGEYAKSNGLAENDVAALVDHAIKSGQAVVSIRNDDPDPRLPFIDSDQQRYPRKGLFNGWPADFPNIPDIWTPPSASSSPANRSLLDAPTPQSVSAFGGSGILSGLGAGPRGILSGVAPEQSEAPPY